jgi:hypothetical protein
MKKIISIIFLLFLVTSNLNCQNTRYKKNISLANESFQNKNFDKAIVYSLRCLEEKPDDFLSLLLLQISNHMLDRYTISKEYGNKILMLPKYTENETLMQMLLYYQGLNFYATKDKDTACKFFTASLNSSRENFLTKKQNEFVYNLCYQ